MKNRESKIKNLLSQNKCNGFTLIEILIYISIIGLVLVGFITFAISISNFKEKVYVEQEVQANSRVALNLITQKILTADGVNVGSSIFGLDPGVLSLSMADPNKNPTIISLTADDGQLQIQEGMSDAITTTSKKVKVTNLVFTNLTSTSDRSNIKIKLTIEYIDTDDVIYKYSYSLETAVSLRQ